MLSIKSHTYTHGDVLFSLTSPTILVRIQIVPHNTLSIFRNEGLKCHPLTLQTAIAFRIIKDFMIQGGDSAGDGTGSVTLGDLNGNENEFHAAQGRYHWS